MFSPLIGLLLACWGERAYIVEGVVVEVTHPTEVVLDHKEIPGLMGPMVMPFEAKDPSLLTELQPGDRVLARFEILDEVGGVLTKVRVTGKGPAPKPLDRGPEPVRPGGTLPELRIPTTGGGELVLGPGQTERVALTFVYTRCPMPEFCPAILARMQALQPHLGEGQRILAVTLDPAHDTLDVLRAYGEGAGADPARWQFGRLEPDALQHLALLAGLPVIEQGGEIVHGVRLLVIDRGGRLLERYDDNRWPLERVVEQLSTGGPASTGASGTLTPE